MNEQQRKDIISTLIAFVHQATRENANTAEVESLPAIASLLLNATKVN